MKRQNSKIRTLRKYYSANNVHEQAVSLRRFKKVLNNLVKTNHPEALVIAATLQCKNESDEDFFKRRSALLNKAIDLNFSPAMVELAEEYYDKQNYQKAFELYENAAKINHSYALKIIALNYELGLHGYKKNLEKARKFRDLALNGIVWSVHEGYEAECCDYDYCEDESEVNIL